MKTIAIIQARMGSGRLPGKVLMDLGGKPVLQWVVEGARLVTGVDNVVVATSTSSQDDVLAAWCGDYGVTCRRGSEDDVLARFHMAAAAEKADAVMRLTADCPLLDPHVCGELAALFRRAGADYAASCNPPSWPDGLDCEIFTFAALETAAKEAIRLSDREHVTPFIRNNRARFKVESLIAPMPGLSGERWTVDCPEDLEFLRQVVKRLPKGGRPSYLDVLAVLESEPNLRTINADIPRNEGLAESTRLEPPSKERSYARSNDLLRRAEKVIPLGSQTFSKSHVQHPQGQAPLFLTHGEGGHVWDVDGNQYIDLVCGLLPVVLGYQDPDVDGAVRRQLSRGASFSLATELEAELAERLVEIVPCAEMARFGKNGTDATSAAVRIARAHTGRDRIAVCGYHGWQDWYIGVTTRNKGVPGVVSALTHVVPYNDPAALDALFKAHPGELAALVMEPMIAVEPRPGYLQEVQEIVHGHGALLVFDEIITGFRYALGGAQELFGVAPDLACFGKAMGNGLPISAVVGKAEYMREMEEVFISSTFGGEALSLAAAIAVIDKMRRETVIETLWKTGEALAEGASELADKHGLGDVFAWSGKAPWKIVAISDHPKARKEAIKTLWAREMARCGVLVNVSHNVCYAHGDKDVAQALAAYDEALGKIAVELESEGLEDRLGGPAIEPVFTVR